MKQVVRDILRIPILFYNRIKKRVGQNSKGFKIGNQFYSFRSADEGNLLLRSAIVSGKPFMAARHGSNELMYFTHGTMSRFTGLCNGGGFFPVDLNLGERFREEYYAASRCIDYFAAWNYRRGRFKEERNVFSKCSPNATLIDINSLSPFLFEEPWSEVMEGKRVLVVHPFAKTIRNQYLKRKELFLDNRVLPAFKELILLPAVQSIGGQCSGFENWFDALDFMKRQIDQIEFDIGLFGCGAYGLLLAAHAKSMGCQSIHVGGALQLLFGIKGKRWEGASYYYDEKFYNDFWVRPSIDETPDVAGKIENGCYW